MSDRLIEDIVGVTESLMVADRVDIEAFAHPDAQLSLNEKIRRFSLGMDSHAGIASQEKLEHLKNKMEEHKAGDGIFKRGSC